MGEHRNTKEAQQLSMPQGLDQRSKIEVVPKMVVPERLRCGTIQKKMS